jgi:hypothetical protein
MDSPMPRAWTRVTERNAKPMRSRWLAWAAFVFGTGRDDSLSSRFSVLSAMIVSDEGFVASFFGREFISPLRFAFYSPIIFPGNGTARERPEKFHACSVFLREHFASTSEFEGIVQFASTKN